MRTLLAIGALFFSIHAHAEFSPRHIRYVSSYDVIGLMIKNFPGHGQPCTEIMMNCQSVTNSNREVIGTSNSVSGQPLMERPNPGFLRWLNQCLAQYSRYEFVPANFSYRKTFAIEYLPPRLKSVVVSDYMKKQWSSIPEKTRDEILEQMVQKFVGPPAAFTAYAPDENWNSFTASVAKTAAALTPTDATVAVAMANLSHTIFLRDEFLRY